MKKKIVILSAHNILVPRLMLERDTLEKAGYSVEVIYRNRIFWGIKTFLQLPTYYLTTLNKCYQEDIWGVHLTHISQILLTPFLKLKGKIVVFDAYEPYSVDISERHFPSILKRPIRYLIEFFEDLFIKFFVDAVLVVSTPKEYLLERYRKYCTLTECLYNVPSSTTVFKDDLKAKFREVPFKIAYAGDFSHDKGSSYFIPLAQLLKKRGLRFEMHLIGPFLRESLQQRLLSEIYKSGISDFVFIHGYMDYASMICFLYGCHVGLNIRPKVKRLSHVGIGCARKNFTYMSSGMVVITLEVGQMAYVIQNENCGIGIRNADNLNHVAAIIENLMEDRSQATSFAQNGIRAITNRYNWENESNKLLSVYSEVYRKHHM